MGGSEVDDRGWAATRGWVEELLPGGERVVAAERLRGGWTSQMRRLRIEGADGQYLLVLRSFVDEFFISHADGLLTREADILTLLGPTDVPAAGLVGVDPSAEHCDHPSLLMTLLPGSVRLDDAGADARVVLLAEQLATIHRVPVSDGNRPRDYQAWTGPERVRVPEATDCPEVWRAAVDGIRREAPTYRPVFLHRDFHPGNVLFTDSGISGVVDWVETSWGPADLDVAHCSTALALLHGPDAGLRFADQYVAAGGQLSAAEDLRYWYLLDALAYSPDAEKVAVPWRELGRTDLAPDLLQQRLETYLQALLA